MNLPDEADLRGAVHRLCLHIAIDGPAGAGKSTVGRGLSEVLGCPYLDTGLMYRAVTRLALSRGVSLADGPGLAALARHVDFSLAAPGRGSLVVDGRPADAVLRSPAVDAAVSQVSAHAAVREVLVIEQRRLAAGQCVVVVGRDIGTEVLPGAPVKLWVTASPEERARRRLQESLLPAGGAVTPEQMLDLIKARDAVDSGRPVSPLRQPPDAVVIETDRLNPSQALARALEAVAAAVQQLASVPAAGEAVADGER